MKSIFIENKKYSYDRVNLDIQEKTKKFSLISDAVFILEADNSYKFITDYFGLRKTKNSILVIENYNFIDKNLISNLNQSFKYIYKPNGDILKNLIKQKNQINDVELILSSGTTSQKKIIVLSKETIDQNTRRINSQFNVDSNACELILMPLFHSFGITRLRCAFDRNSSIYLSSKLLDHNILKKCFDYENKVFIGAVSKGLDLFVSFFKKYLTTQKDKFFYIETGSMEISSNLLHKINTIFKNKIHFHHYGSSEASRSFFANNKDLEFNIQNLGKISKGLNFKIIKNELCIKGSNLFLGYIDKGKISTKINDEEMFSKDGFFKTGDYVELDDKSLIFKSRKKEIINLNGFKYSPIELENKLFDHIDEKFDACVIQFPGDNDYFIVFEHNQKSNKKYDDVINKISKEVFLIKPIRIIYNKIKKTSSGKKIRKYELYSDKF